MQRCAKRFGDSQLAQCANQISSDLMPEGAALHDYSELFTSTQAYISGVQEDVRSFVRMIGADRFSRGDLMALQEVVDLHFQEPTNLASVLWQNGLLGYVDEAGRRRFYSLGDVEQFHLPPEAGTYVLHPCLVYAVGGIRHVGEEDSAGAGDARRTRPPASPKRSDLPEAPDAAPRSGGNQALLKPGPAEVRDRQVSGLPSGLVTLLFSDIEGSTRLVKALRDRYWQILAEHRRLVRAAVAEYAGYEVDAQGDAFFVTFADAKQAVLCALEIQRALAGHEWRRARRSGCGSAFTPATRSRPREPTRAWPSIARPGSAPPPAAARCSSRKRRRPSWRMRRRSWGLRWWTWASTG